MYIADKDSDDDSSLDRDSWIISSDNCIQDYDDVCKTVGSFSTAKRKRSNFEDMDHNLT